MRTYRLQFSENHEIMSRRLNKAIFSNSERLLCIGFGELSPELKKLAPHMIWAKEVCDRLEKKRSPWDQLHLKVHRPEDLKDLKLNNFEQIVIEPKSVRDKNRWLLELKKIPLNELQAKVKFEFQPWDHDRPMYFTVQEIVSFLYELKYHIPQFRAAPRKGVNLWDWRIKEEIELEAQAYQVEKFHHRQEAPKISVIIPSYNNKFFLSNVLRHFRFQTENKSEFEIVVVDDGSDDNTFEYLKLNGVFSDLQATYIYWPRAQVRKRGDKLYRAGLSRNLGVRESRSEKIVFLDSDMLVPKDFVSSTILNLEKYDVIQFPRYHINQEMSTASTNYLECEEKHLYIEEESYWKKFFEAQRWEDLKNYWKYTCTYGLAMRKKSFFEAGRFPHFYISYGFEDTELGYRLFKLGKKFFLDSKRLLHLTSYSLSEYQFSKKNRHRLLSRTAKLFFLNTLEINHFHDLEGFMQGEHKFFPRLKTSFDFRDKNKQYDGNV